MAFVNYIMYIGPGIRALGRLFNNLQEKKADDGKISLAEAMDCIGDLVEDLLKIFAPIIK